MRLRKHNHLPPPGGNHTLCWALLTLGMGQVFDGRFSQAETCFDEAITLQENMGKSYEDEGLLATKAALAFWRGRLATATRSVEVAVPGGLCPEHWPADDRPDQGARPLTG